MRAPTERSPGYRGQDPRRVYAPPVSVVRFRLNFNLSWERRMTGIPKVLILVAGAAFIMAVVSALFTGTIRNVGPEAFSRACTNLALIAIAMSMAHKDNGKSGKPM